MKMDVRRVDGWKGFLNAIEELRQDYGSHERALSGGRMMEKPNRLLFRGQPREDQVLATTLERKSKLSWHVGSYLSCVSHYVAEIESFTGDRWGVPDRPEIEVLLKQQDFMRLVLPCYDYLVYLRHHGFPSPLLDWTESPFIAAYFAYTDATAASDCAVYCFIETAVGVKGGKGGEPAIHVEGPHVTTEKTHFAQKAWYTIAAKWNEGERRHDFCPHESVLDMKDSRQDILFKIVLPAAKRGDILDTLDDFNINHFTLFHSTDALVRALASREFDIGEHSSVLRRTRIKDP